MAPFSPSPWMIHVSSSLGYRGRMGQKNTKGHTYRAVRDPKTRNKMSYLYLDAVLLVGDSLLLLLLFMACRVCLSVVCRVCLSVPCLVSLSVRPWMAL